MSAQLISGTEISKSIREDLKKEINELALRGVQPGLAVILVGEDPASKVYVGRKAKTCEQLGIYSEVHRMPDDTSEEILLQRIKKLNADPRIHGLLVQLPIPKHISEKNVIDAIAVE